MCLVPNTRSWHPWANKIEEQIRIEGKIHSPLLGNERLDLERKGGSYEQYSDPLYNFMFGEMK